MQSNNLNLEIYVQYLNSPIGWLQVSASQQGVTAIDFDSPSEQPERPNEHSQQCVLQLQEYFAGERQLFELTLVPQGTDFQLSVWQALQKIPYGQSCSYLDIALAINNPKAVRAVGAANGRNPIPIIIPCHRVIGKNGSLVGFSGGMDKKIWLLKHENVLGSAEQHAQEELF